MKYRLLMTLICTTYCAYAQPSIPTSCPDVKAISEVGIYYSTITSEWELHATSNYGTNNQWLLNMTIRSPRNNIDEARKKALYVLSQMQFEFGPKQYGSTFVCRYHMNNPQIDNFVEVETDIKISDK